MDKLSELKAAAMAATPGPWGINRAGNTIVSNQSHPVATLSNAFHRQLADGGVGKDAEFIAAANPAAILALLAELEDKGREINVWRQRCENAEMGSDHLQHRIAELEAVKAAAEKLVRCKGRYHSEQNYRALATLFGVTAPDLPPIDGDSEAVIAELRAKLATPVRLPANVSAQDMRETFNYLMDAEEAQAAANGFNQGLIESGKLLHEQGFTVEGDE